MRPNQTAAAFASTVVAATLVALFPGAVSAQFPPLVRGIVVERASGSPVVGALVTPADGTLHAVTDTDGAFVLRGLMPGEHTLRIEALGFHSGEVVVEARNGVVSRVRVRLDAAPLQLRGLAVVSTRGEAAPGTRVIGPARIRTSGARDVGELLEGEPGVTVVRRGGPGAPSTLSIRGSAPDEVLVLVDGTAINSRISGEADLSTVSLEGVDRVVVLPGARSARWGPRALAGVVSVETSSPERRELAFRSEVGAWGERALSTSAGGRLGSRNDGSDIRGRVRGQWREISGDFFYDVPEVRGGGRATRVNADARSLSLGADGEVRSGGFVVRGRADLADVERGMPGSIFAISPDARQSQRRWSGVVSASGGGLDRSWAVSVDGQRQAAAFEDPSPPSGPPLRVDTRVDAVGGEGHGGVWLGPLQARGGFDVRTFHIESTSLDSGAPTSTHTTGVWTSVAVSHPVTPALELDLSAGLRADGSSLLPGIFYSPRVSLALSGEHLSAHLSGGRSFSPATLADQFFQEGVLVRPNPNLEPERVREELEGGLDLRGRRGVLEVEAGISAFAADIEGMIIWFPDHRFVWRPENFDVDRRGLEARARIAITGTAELRSSLSHHRVEYTDGTLDGQVVYRPRTTAALTASAQRGPWRGEIEGRRMGTRRTVPGSALNTLAPYWTVDLRLGWSTELGPGRLRIDGAVTNVLDQDAAMLVDYPAPGRGWLLSLRVEPRSDARSGPEP